MTFALAVAVLQVHSVAVTPPSFSESMEPQVAIDTKNRVHVAYGMGPRIFISVSGDEGRTFSDPVEVGSNGLLTLGMRRGPRIAAYEGTVTITAIQGQELRGRDGDIFAYRSTDGGATWGDPVQVNDVESSAREGLHAMAIGPDGTLACSWLDMRSEGTKLYLASSDDDGGATWSTDRLVYESPSGTICECCHPSLSFAPDGTLHIMFRNALEGARDMYHVTTRDLQSFSDAKKLGSGTWMLDACPMDGGMISASGEGVATVWRRENSIYECGADGVERLLGRGMNPWTASGPQGTATVWQNGERLLLSLNGGHASVLAPAGKSPVVEFAPGGGFAIAAWTNHGIRAARIEVD